MLRALLLVMFLAANAALAAVQLGWLKWRDVLPATGREPARIETQLEPGNIRLTEVEISANAPGDVAGPSKVSGTGSANHDEHLDTSAQPASASSVSASTATAASQALAATAPAAVSSDAAAASQATTAVAATACLDIGPFASNDAQQARGLLLAALPSGQGDLQSIPLDKRYWVHLSPVPNKAAADKQVAQLRSAGVTEYFLLNDDGSNLVVSLGLFNDRERAVRLMAAAQKKGITPQLSERANAKSRIIYRIAGINANAATQVRSVVTQQWSAQLVRACPAPAGSPPEGAH
ncbi:SPOR domain-containing protein [Pandoraea sp. SD6-2]|uniref:SPOR domain-containing protein n=1 Tax=Pandoraea sp. SD6-2 TaxID=1286093 RepID=UPI00032F1450|nr:SPOR domain-containing protein [Pandoraea sp. SD6-2]EON14401.1 sporulation domain-containing protein [Pandoraea sp. SD6-2]